MHIAVTSGCALIVQADTVVAPCAYPSPSPSLTSGRSTCALGNPWGSDWGPPNTHALHQRHTCDIHFNMCASHVCGWVPWCIMWRISAWTMRSSSGLGVALCAPSVRLNRRQHHIIHQAERNCDASCVVVWGLVYHIVLRELLHNEAVQYDTPGPKL